jgi:hypothetical protein
MDSLNLNCGPPFKATNFGLQFQIQLSAPIRRSAALRRLGCFFVVAQNSSEFGIPEDGSVKFHGLLGLIIEP